MVVSIWHWQRLWKEVCALESLAHFSLGVTQPTFKVAQCLLGATLCYHDSLQSPQISRARAGHARLHKLCHIKASIHGCAGDHRVGVVLAAGDCPL